MPRDWFAAHGQEMFVLKGVRTLAMKTGTLLSATSVLLGVVLLVLSGVAPGVRHASAQTQEACPLPAGVTPPPAPAVTAQQVEDGSASLMAF